MLVHSGASHRRNGNSCSEDDVDETVHHGHNMVLDAVKIKLNALLGCSVVVFVARFSESAQHIDLSTKEKHQNHEVTMKFVHA